MLPNYCNHVMAREMPMSIANVIREGINAAACSSAALRPMADESTDVPKTGAMALYLRLLIGGVYQTVFWGPSSAPARPPRVPTTPSWTNSRPWACPWPCFTASRPTALR